MLSSKHVANSLYVTKRKTLRPTYRIEIFGLHDMTKDSLLGLFLTFQICTDKHGRPGGTELDPLQNTISYYREGMLLQLYKCALD